MAFNHIGSIHCFARLKLVLKAESLFLCAHVFLYRIALLNSCYFLTSHIPETDHHVRWYYVSILMCLCYKDFYMYKMVTVFIFCDTGIMVAGHLY